MSKSNQKLLRLLLALVILFNSLTPVFSAQKPLSHQYINPSQLSANPVRNNWNGFEIIEFKFNGVDAKIVFPKKSNPSKNWIWRTQFWGHEPQTDIALLNRGFHVVYVDLVDLYGNTVALNRLSDFYNFLVKNFGLNKKTCRKPVFTQISKRSRGPSMGLTNIVTSFL